MRLLEPLAFLGSGDARRDGHVEPCRFCPPGAPFEEPAQRLREQLQPRFHLRLQRQAKLQGRQKTRIRFLEKQEQRQYLQKKQIESLLEHTEQQGFDGFYSMIRFYYSQNFTGSSSMASEQWMSRDRRLPSTIPSIIESATVE
ncbi:hypothetical protein IF1G_11315 [Cordyceps javanica]|uniref:Uncharacterized protein n=1 Tax=Cordyceps javanica TaxID=43265 RepID=A0A545UKN5_9HYPO|nr:hypothetical protein IF1G_11315 [Cordyceps javanica]